MKLHRSLIGKPAVEATPLNCGPQWVSEERAVGSNSRGELRVILRQMRLHRRDFIKASAAGTVTLVGRHGFSFAKRHSDDALLEDLAHRSFQYFWDASDSETGICRDLLHSEPADNVKKRDEARGSTGVTGFCLTGLCIAAERKWITREQAKTLIRDALRSYTNGRVPA